MRTTISGAPRAQHFPAPALEGKRCGVDGQHLTLHRGHDGAVQRELIVDYVRGVSVVHDARAVGGHAQALAAPGIVKK